MSPAQVSWTLWAPGPQTKQVGPGTRPVRDARSRGPFRGRRTAEGTPGVSFGAPPPAGGRPVPRHQQLSCFDCQKSRAGDERPTYFEWWRYFSYKSLSRKGVPGHQWDTTYSDDRACAVPTKASRPSTDGSPHRPGLRDEDPPRHVSQTPSNLRMVPPEVDLGGLREGTRRSTVIYSSIYPAPPPWNPVPDSTVPGRHPPRVPGSGPSYSSAVIYRPGHTYRSHRPDGHTYGRPVLGQVTYL